MSSSRRRKPLVTRKVRSDDEETNDDDSRMTNGDGDAEEEIPEDLPEGTVVVEPEAVEENSFKGPEFPSSKKKVLEATGYLATVYCSACGEQINTSKKGDARRHPELSVLICKRCYKFHTSGPIEKDEDGLDEHCRWCSEGGNLFGCDYCHNAFCQACIKRNLGRAEFSRVKDAEKFKCYVCNPKPLAAMVEQCNSVIEKIDKEFQKLNELGKKKKETDKQKSSSKSEKSTPSTSDKNASLVVKLPGLGKQLPNTSTPKPKEIIPSTVNQAVNQGNRVVLSTNPGRPTFSALLQQHASNAATNKQVIYVEPQKGSAKQLVYVQPRQPQQSLVSILPNQQPRDPLDWTNVNVKNVPFITDQLIQSTTELLNLLRSLRSNVQGPSNSLSLIATEGRKTAISCMKSGVDIFLGQLSNIAGTNIVQANQKEAPTTANLLQSQPSQSSSVRLTGGNSSVKSTSQKDLIMLDSENDDSQVEIVDITDSSEKSSEVVKEIKKDEKSNETSKGNDKIDEKKDVKTEEEEKVKDGSASEERKTVDKTDKNKTAEKSEKNKTSEKTEKNKSSDETEKNKSSDETEKTDNEMTEDENDAAHLELLQELQELSGTVDPNESVTKDSKKIDKNKNKNEEKSEDSDSKNSDENDDDESEVKKGKKSEKSDSKKNEKTESKKNEKSGNKKDDKNDSKKNENSDRKKDEEKSDSKKEKSEKEKDKNETDNSDSDTSSSESDIEDESSDNSKKDSDFDIKSERRTRRSIKQESEKSKFKELREKRKARERSAKKKDEKRESKSKEKKKKKGGSDESDFDDELEDEIEKLEKEPVLKKGKKKVKKETEDDDDDKDKVKKTKGEKKSSEDKSKKKKKKGLDLDDLSSTEEVDDDDNDEDKEENEDDEVPMDQDDDETEEETKDEDDIVEDSSDSEIVLSPRKKKAALEKKKAEKKKKGSNDSDSDSEDNISPKKKKLRSSLLDTKLSDSESDFQPAKKKGKKRKADSSAEGSTKSSDSEKEFIALGKKSKKKGKGNQKKKDGTGKRRKRIKKVASSDDDEEEEDDDQTEAESDELEEMKKKKKRRKKKGEEDSEEENEDDEDGSPSKGKRKDIRKLISNKKLKDETKAASKAEEERRQRITEKQKKYNNIIQIVDESSPTKAPVTKQLILERDEDGDPILELDKDLVTKLKPHQVEAVEFMWNCTVESLKMLKDEKEEGAGCILAHCMGLGKTLSVISFLHTMMANYETTNFSTALIVCPLNTVLNWQNEVNMWLGNNEHQLEVFELASVKVNESRAKLLEEWLEDGGIMIIGYEMFRNLSQGNNCKKKKLKEIFKKTLLDPGPDFVVCDEGHILKNDASALSKAMNQIKTRRRIVLTGTPLQNNLVEYHCMVSFVKPNLLGTRKEFLNRFVNPITNGQCMDSSAHDVRVMKRRAHVLHEKLAGCVQRKDYSALTKYLPPKHEYVMAVRLATIQCDLYSKYLEMGGITFGGEMVKSKGAKLFSDYQALMRIWTHPWVLKMDEIRQEMKNMFDDEDSFIDDSGSGSNSESEAKSSGSESDSEKSMSFADSDSDKDKKKKKKQKEKKSNDEEEPPKESFAGEIVKKWKTRSRGEYNDGDFETEVKQPFSTGWFTEFVKEDDQFKIELSGKLTLLFEILRMCEEIGDKVLVFSQSLLSLDLIEAFLEHIDKTYDESLNNDKNGDTKDKDKTKDGEDKTEDGESKDKSKKGENKKEDDAKTTDSVPAVTEEIFGKRWLLGQDYLRMDGSTGAPQRAAMAKNFNDPDNYRLRLFLISTKAGGLGINLVGANRVIIFDASWNPSHDVQSIFRVYRFGQEKPVYVYRFLAQGTMEEKIYERQVTKQSLSQRVIDEHQIDRHFNSNDLRELYNFKPDRLDDPNRKERPTPALPKDTLLAELLTDKKEWIVGYHEHDSLLENKTDQELSEEERKAAWEEFENERKGLINTVRNTFMGQMPNTMNFNPYAYGNPNMMSSQMSPQLNQENLLRIVQEMKQKFPHLPQEQLTMQVQNVIRNMISRQIQQQQWEQRRQIEHRELQQQQQLQQIQARILQQQNQLRMQQASRPPLGMNMPLSSMQPRPGSSSSLLAQTLTNGAPGKPPSKKS